MKIFTNLIISTMMGMGLVPLSAKAEGLEQSNQIVKPEQISSEKVNGIVRKVDMKQRKLTIRHEEIKMHQMPPMTMVFVVAEGVELNELQANDAIAFTLDSKMNVIAVEKNK